LKDIIEELTTEKSIIKFIEYRDEESAYEDLQVKLDALWILPEDLLKSVNDYLYKKEHVVKVIESRQSTVLGISREKLFAKLYPYISRELYNKYMEEKYSRHSITDIFSKFILSCVCNIKNLSQKNYID